MEIYARYCKRCGHLVQFEYSRTEAHCQNCDISIPMSDTIIGFVLDARITQLKAMHDLMCEANDENIYMTWIYTVPDCPSHEDFVSIAINDEEYNACFDLFVKLIAKKGNRY